jgi:diguanylate cyclase (GGDEF)-like protein
MRTSPDADPIELPLDGLLSRLLPAVLARQGDLLAVKDAKSGRYVHVNASMARALARDESAVIGRTDADLFDADLAAIMRLADQKALAQGEPVLSEHRFEIGGERHEFSVLRLAPPPDVDGRRWLASVWSDQTPHRQRDTQLRQALGQIEQQQRANEQLRKELGDQGVRDPASGLYTRAHFDDQLRREVDLSTREHREFATVFIEIDPPTERVRALGAEAQARVLEALGRLLRSGTRAMDASCRVDDRRFAVLLSGVGLATAHARMEGLRRQCATQIVVQDGQELGFTVSMGVASFPHTSHTQDDLLVACEAALAEAQRRGGNLVTLAAIRFET